MGRSCRDVHRRDRKPGVEEVGVAHRRVDRRRRVTGLFDARVQPVADEVAAGHQPIGAALPRSAVGTAAAGDQASPVSADRLSLLCSGGLERSSERGCRSSHQRWRSGSSQPSLMIRYCPSLFYLPVLLLLGVFSVVVPGGFIIVFAGAYIAVTGAIAYCWLTVGERRGAAHARRRLARTQSDLAREANRQSVRRPGMRAPTPAPAVVRSSQLARGTRTRN